MARKDTNQQVPLEITNLDNLSSEMTNTFGGKACGLARLISLNAKVPEGFTVSVAKIPTEQWPSETRNRFIHKVRGLLYRGPVVVRSSALGEDSDEKSFAGMFETVLGITTETGALTAADRCIESGNSERVKKYAGLKSSIPVGLVVQSQVAAKAAGVCFTCDPTGRDHAVVIEAVAGLGDRMVSGQAEPERFKVYRSGTGWTPLFPRASGIIMEVGGLMCHAAVVARELGIPAVFDIAHATRTLKNGQHIKVDGTSGIVTLNA